MAKDDAEGLIGMFSNDPLKIYRREQNRIRAQNRRNKTRAVKRKRVSALSIIQDQLEQGDKIDVYKCFELTGTVSIAIHIHMLRKKGLKIVSARKEGMNTHEYWLVKD